MPVLTRRQVAVLLLFAFGGSAALALAARWRRLPSNSTGTSTGERSLPTPLPAQRSEASKEPATVPAKRPDSRLDSTLSQLVAQLGHASPEAVAAQAPVARGTAVAVSIRTTGDPQSLHAWITSHSGIIANIGVDVTEAYMPVTELTTLAAQPNVIAVQAIVPAQVERGR